MSASNQPLTMKLPITKPDFSVVEEEVAFRSAFPAGSVTHLIRVEASLPLGLVLEEGDWEGGSPGNGAPLHGFTVVSSAGQGAAAAAGVRAGDVLRCCSAAQLKMQTPTWQLMAGGIGRPKLVRFMYQTDGRPFEEVLEALGSNRLESRPAIIVLERRIDA